MASSGGGDVADQHPHIIWFDVVDERFAEQGGSKRTQQRRAPSAELFARRQGVAQTIEPFLPPSAR
jgi:hypothetical protein